MASESKHVDRKRSDRLLKVLAPFSEIVIVTHDNPDPDALATGWGIDLLIREKLGRSARLVGGGEIMRAENRHMVRLLEPPIELVDHIEVPPDAATVLVDCGPSSANHLLGCDRERPVAVIDHHPCHLPRNTIAFTDIRPEVAASATIAASYLRQQAIEPGVKLAVAMVYAIRTETRGADTRHSDLDRSIVAWLTERSEPALLAEIENAPLPRDYFADMLLAIQNTFVYDDTAFCLLPRATGPEIVAEVADLLIRDEKIARVLCGAVIDRDLVFSARTARGDGDAAELLREMLTGLGRAGGHEHRAGGKAAGMAPKGRMTEDMQDELRNRWLTACHVERLRGTRLVPKSEIVDNL